MKPHIIIIIKNSFLSLCAREEQYLLQRKQQEEALRRQQPQGSASPSPHAAKTPLQDVSSAEVINFDNTSDNSSELVQDEDASGSGDESLAVVTATTTTTTNYTESSDRAIINHIYEIYSSLTSMEHKVGLRPLADITTALCRWVVVEMAG